MRNHYGRQFFSIIFLAAFFFGFSILEVNAAAPTYGPDLVTLNVINSSEINLSWTAVTADPAVTGYKIERESPVGGGFTTIVSDTGSSNNSYKDTNLAPGATYNYRVSAINADGTGPASANPAYAATYPIPTLVSLPLAPKNLKAAPTSASTIILSWTAPTDSTVTGYKINRNYSVIANTGSADRSYSDTNLLSGVTYDYQVFAVNSAGTGNGSARVIATTPTLPYAPQSANAAAGDGVATVRWTSPLYQSIGGITGYVVWDINNATNSISVASGTLSVTITGLTNGVFYSFGVAALNLAGQGPTTNTNSVTPAAGLIATTSSAPASSEVQSLKDQIASLTALLQRLIAQFNEKQSASGVSLPPPSAAPSASPTTTAKGYSRNLTIGSSGGDVMDLQNFLIARDIGLNARNLADAGASGYFGSLTQKALAEYQDSVGIDPASGFFGPKTREYINSLTSQ